MPHQHRSAVNTLPTGPGENALLKQDRLDAAMAGRARIQRLERHSEILTFAAVLSLGIGFVVSPMGILVGSLVALGFMERRRDRRKKLRRLIADMEGNGDSPGPIP